MWVERGVLTAPRLLDSIHGGARTTPPILLVFAFAMFLSFVNAASVSEDFSADPNTRGWRSFGDASLFHWNATNQNLGVTWDSSGTNSYFWLPLHTIISKSDEFSLTFDL